ncbi:MAG: outer membrane protein assembly factor BamA [Thiobacillaceae bacterium]
MTKNHITLALLAAFAAQTGFAADPFVVRDIRVEGIQRTEAGTVFSYLPVKVGDTLTDDKTTAAIKALYATGFFKDVRLEAQDGVLIVTVEERPSIAKVTLSGTKEFSEDDLKKGLKEAGLTDGRVLDRSLLEKAEQELQRQYFNRGKYAVEIKSTVTPLERNRVAVQFDVVEGDSAKIRQISIIGNKAFKEKEILDQFASTTPGWLTWYSKSDQYSKTKLAGDIENVRSFYLNRGYLEFNVDSTQVSITPDKQDIYITVNMTEGPRYTVSDVKLAGQMLVPEDELKKLIDIKPGDVFERDKLTSSSKKIGDRLGNEGYAFANVNAVPEIDKDKNQVAFTLYVDPGRRVYVNRVNVGGNTKTRDEVIRREVRQMESGWYNAEKINLSKDRLNRLGYFNEVNIETPSVAGTTDQVDVNIGLTEKSTGNIQLGAGFSSSEGLVISGSVSQANVFGSGNSVAVQLNTGKVNTVYSLSFTNPYFTLDGISLGYDIYRRDTNTGAALNSNLTDYKSSTYGIGARFGLPLNEKDRISFGATFENTALTGIVGNPNGSQQEKFVSQFGSDNTTVRLDTSFARDTRDSYLFPTRGMLQRVSAEIGTPPGSLQYYKLTLQNQQYFPLSRDFTLLLNGELGYGAGLSGKPLPFFKNLYAGGNGSVRGYSTATVGPKDVDKNAIGGDQRVIANAELFFPLPGLKDDQSLRMSAFFDAGASFGPGDYLNRFGTFAFGDLRYSAGVAALWVSPLGPLKFSLAKPLAAQTDDKTEVFQFTFGNSF